MYLQKIVSTNEYRAGDILTINILKRIDDNGKEMKYLKIKKTGQDVNNLSTFLDLKNNLLLSEKDFVNLSENTIYSSKVLHVTESSIPGMKTLIIEVNQ